MKPHTFVVLLLFLATGLHGQDRPVADLALQVTKTPTGITPPGSYGIITLTVTNNGPEIAGSVPAGDPATIDVSTILPLTYEYGSTLSFFNLGEPGCGLIRLVLDAEPGMTETQIFYIQFLSNLASGASVTCNYEFFVNPQAMGDVVNVWDVRASNDEDPNPDNNEAAIIFNLGLPPNIPTLSPIGLVILGLGLVGGFLALRRGRPES